MGIIERQVRILTGLPPNRLFITRLSRLQAGPFLHMRNCLPENLHQAMVPGMTAMGHYF